MSSAARAGLRTAFIRRPKEYGPDVVRDLSDERKFDFNGDSFLELAAWFAAQRDR